MYRAQVSKDLATRGFQKHHPGSKVGQFRRISLSLSLSGCVCVFVCVCGRVQTAN
jgi:hypothetical protein